MTDFHTGLQGSYFGFVLDGIEVGWFTTVSGIGIDIEVVEHDTTSGTGRMKMKMPGRATFTEVVLKRGLTTDMQVQDWFNDVVAGKTERKTCEIVVYDREGDPKATFSFDQVFPSKLEVSDMSSTSSEAMIETLTLRHELLAWT